MPRDVGTRRQPETRINTAVVRHQLQIDAMLVPKLNPMLVPKLNPMLETSG